MNLEKQAQASSITQGTWCPNCLGRNKTIKDLCKLAKDRGGLCLSKKYRGQNKPLKWQCSEGHRWSAAPKSITGVGRWCPVCSKLTMMENQRKYNISDIQNYVKKKMAYF